MPPGMSVRRRETHRAAATSRGTSATTVGDASTTCPAIATTRVPKSARRGASGGSARKPKRGRPAGGERADSQSSGMRVIVGQPGLERDSGSRRWRRTRGLRRSSVLSERGRPGPALRHLLRLRQSVQLSSVHDQRPHFGDHAVVPAVRFRLFGSVDRSSVARCCQSGMHWPNRLPSDRAQKCFSPGRRPHSMIGHSLLRST